MAEFRETQRLRDELAGPLERLARACGEGGQVERAVDYARRWVGLDPLHEPRSAN